MTPEQRATREQRTKQCNDLLHAIAQHGRRFFLHEGRVSRLELDDRHRVWFVDAWSQRRIYTHYERGRWKGFAEGGTLRDLIGYMRDYITRGADEHLQRILRMLGPWPAHVCGGDLWGYGESMAAVRSSAARIFGYHGSTGEGSNG